LNRLPAAHALPIPEPSLDLNEIALAIRDGQSTTTELLQAIHALVDNRVAATEPSAPPYYPPTAQYVQRRITRRHVTAAADPATARIPGLVWALDNARGSRDRDSHETSSEQPPIKGTCAFPECRHVRSQPPGVA